MKMMMPSKNVLSFPKENLDAASQFQKNLKEFLLKHNLPVHRPFQRFLHGALLRRKILLGGSLGLSLIVLGIMWMRANKNKIYSSI